jgi:hypothetical protein
MKVETYEVISLDEIDGTVVNEVVDEEALLLIDQLNLTGQQSLVKDVVVDDEVVVKRNPYRKMTGEEAAIFNTLLPRHVKLTDYNDGPIPLRVLQVAAHAKELFDELQVYCPSDPRAPDPLLVGIMGGRSYADNPLSGGEIFLLARWGEILEPLDDLRKKARVIIVAKVRATLAANKGKIAQLEASLGEQVDSFLLTGEQPGFWFDGIRF